MCTVLQPFRVLVTTCVVLLGRSSTVVAFRDSRDDLHYDNARRGANTAETKRVPGNINESTFGQVFHSVARGMTIIGQALLLA